MIPVFFLGAGAAAAVGVGFRAIKSLMDSNSSSSAASGGSYRVKPDRNQLYFVASLLGTAANADGSISEQEKSALASLFESKLKEYDIPESDQTEMKRRFYQPLKFSALRDTFAAVNEEHRTEWKQKDYLKMVDQITKSDTNEVQAERVFDFKCRLMFEDLPDMQVYQVHQNPAEIPHNPDILQVIDSQFVKTAFPATKLECLGSNQLLTTHPVNEKELVPLDLFCEDSYPSSKAVELIEIARDAGAKRVHILQCVKSSDHTQLDFATDTSANVFKIGRGSVSIGAAIDKLMERGEESVVTFEFEGNRPSRVLNFLGFSRKRVVSRTKWLKNDPYLRTFANSCFGSNRVQSFSWDIEYSEIANSLASARLAVECSLVVHGGAKTSSAIKHKSDVLRNIKTRYHIEF